MKHRGNFPETLPCLALGAHGMVGVIGYSDRTNGSESATIVYRGILSGG